MTSRPALSKAKIPLMEEKTLVGPEELESLTITKQITKTPLREANVVLALHADIYNHTLRDLRNMVEQNLEPVKTTQAQMIIDESETVTKMIREDLKVSEEVTDMLREDMKASDEANKVLGKGMKAYDEAVKIIREELNAFDELMRKFRVKTKALRGAERSFNILKL